MVACFFYRIAGQQLWEILPRDSKLFWSPDKKDNFGSSLYQLIFFVRIGVSRSISICANHRTLHFCKIFWLSKNWNGILKTRYSTANTIFHNICRFSRYFRDWSTSSFRGAYEYLCGIKSFSWNVPKLGNLEKLLRQFWSYKGVEQNGKFYSAAKKESKLNVFYKNAIFHLLCTQHWIN